MCPDWKRMNEIMKCHREKWQHSCYCWSLLMGISTLLFPRTKFALSLKDQKGLSHPTFIVLRKGRAEINSKIWFVEDLLKRQYRALFDQFLHFQILHKTEKKGCKHKINQQQIQNVCREVRNVTINQGWVRLYWRFERLLENGFLSFGQIITKLLLPLSEVSLFNVTHIFS